MKQVGIRELKARLSHYLREVAGGELIEVTDRGKVVAELRPPGPGEAEPIHVARFRQWVRDGKLLPASEPPSRGTFAPVTRLPAGTAQRLLDDVREDRGLPGD